MKRAKKGESEELFENGNESVGDSDDEASVSSEKIDVEFEAFGLCDDDIDGISQLLRQMFLKSNVNLTEMAKILVDQTNVGCIFKTVDEDDIDPADEDNDTYGVVSVLDMKENQSKNAVQQIKTVLQKRLQQQQKHLDENVRKNFDEAFQTSPKRVGFLINERCINLPHHIALPAFENLIKEIQQSGRRFDQFMMMLKIHKQQNATDGASSAIGAGGPSAKKKKKRKQKSVAKAFETDAPVLFTNGEEEFLAEECDIYFDYNVTDECDSDSLYAETNYKPFRRVVLFDEEILQKFIQKMSNEIKSSSR